MVFIELEIENNLNFSLWKEESKQLKEQTKSIFLILNVNDYLK